MINNGDHNYLSNQILGPLTPPQGNLGGDGSGGFTGTLSGVNFNQFAGNQYFELRVIPEPSTFLLAGLAFSPPPASLAAGEPRCPPLGVNRSPASLFAPSYSAA